MDKPEITEILDLLTRHYGPRRLLPNYAPIAELIQTILSQNTSDINSRPAFRALKEAFQDWDSILNATIEQIAAPISRAGLGQIKALRIQQALREIKQRQGKLDLSFLAGLPVSEAREWLKQLPGVGDKTANCVLLFSLGKPALPVDTHIFRVSKRLGLLMDKSSLEEAHRILGDIVPPDEIYEFHVLMIEHGRQICRAQRPRCPECDLKEICPGCHLL